MVIYKRFVLLFVFSILELIRNPYINEIDMKCEGSRKRRNQTKRMWYNEGFELFSEDVQSNHLQGYWLSLWIWQSRILSEEKHVEWFISWFNQRGDIIDLLK